MPLRSEALHLLHTTVSGLHEGRWRRVVFPGKGLPDQHHSVSYNHCFEQLLRDFFNKGWYVLQIVPKQRSLRLLLKAFVGHFFDSDLGEEVADEGKETESCRRGGIWER